MKKSNKVVSLKGVYPVILQFIENQGYSVYVPDFDINTDGENLSEAIEMARDAISIVGVDYLEDNKNLPVGGSKTYELKDGEIQTLVDVDFTEYKRKLENKAVKKNCTIPYWLNEEATEAGVNFSKVLKEALIDELGLEEEEKETCNC